MSKTETASAPHHAVAGYLPIEDYAVIGDLHTVALVGKNGSIDWCCLPRFDSPSVFGAILDIHKGGFFRLAPSKADDFVCRQLYLPETNVLLTRFLSNDGVAELTDFMPIKKGDSDPHQHHIVRSVTVVQGTVSFTLTCRPAFNYACDTHTLEVTGDGAVFHSQQLHLALAASQPLEQDGQGGVQATFVLHEGQSAYFLLESAKEHGKPPTALPEGQYQEMLQETLKYWRVWLSQCTYQGRWREMVHRSALVLKLLTYQPTGAIVAAPTTSLPEEIGGNRNWDYRFTWLRDASFTLYSLLSLGFTGEARAFMGWLDARCHESHSDGSMQPMYGIDGEQNLSEYTLDHLEGYRQSKPVRIGNGAYKQTQLDIYGTMMDAVYIYNRYDAISYDLWENLETILGWLNKHWQDHDEGMWEVRGGAKEFVDSRVMCWVAFDRALRMARKRGLPSSMDVWMKASTEIYKQVMTKGWNEQEHSFVQYYGGDAVDASALLMVLTRFAGSTEPRMQSTIQRIQHELAHGALVHRYNTAKAANDGMKGTEGAFGACSFWLAEALARGGHLYEARSLLERMLSFSNHVGLYAEEVSSTGTALGNFPQAFTHLALITACCNIDSLLNNSRDVLL